MREKGPEPRDGPSPSLVPVLAARPALSLGVTERVDIDHVSLSGEGVGRAGELEVRVPGLFGGERASVEIVHRSRQHARAFARPVSIERAHAARRDAPCPRHVSRGGSCGGCPLMELDEAAQREQKRAMLRALGLEVDALIHAGPSLGYRFSSKRVAFGHAGSLALGSFSRGTHEGADMEGCLVDHPRITEAADELAREASALSIAPFDEARGEGDLRYAWLKTDGERVLLTLITASEESVAARTLPPRLRVPDGVAWSVQPARGNAIRGSEPRILRGAASLSIVLAGTRIDAGPLGFLQPSPLAIERAYLDLVRDETDRPLGGALAWDLYAGAGITTALLRQRFARVVPCESYAESAAALGVEPCTAEAFLAAARETPELVIANPPRKGLGDEVCDAITRLAVPRLQVMSCGPEALARDLARLEANGWRRASLTAYDTLPQTPHVELIARLVRGH